jgi:hypothetical protein
MKRKREKLKSWKWLLTTELDLTTSEAEKFCQSIILDDKQFEIRHQKMRTYKKSHE